MTSTGAIITWRDSGVTRAITFFDPSEAVRMAPYYAEIHGECEVHFVRHTDRVVHSRAVPHERIPLAPEVKI